MGHIVLISHRKGGVGKSIISINLAAALADKGRTSVVIDVDMSTKSSFRMRQVRDSLHEAGGGSSTFPDVTDYRLAGKGHVGDKLEMSSVMRELAEAYDYVLIDAGAGDPPVNSVALEIADAVVIPFTCEHGDYMNSVEYISQIGQFRALRPTLKAGVVINRFKPNRVATSAVLDETSSEHFPLEVLGAPIPERTSLAQNSYSGSTVFDAGADGQVRAAFGLVARDVIKMLES